MSKSSKVYKTIGYASGTSIAASLGALLVGACIFGFQFSQWVEWEGRLIGVSGTVAGIVGAIIGLRIALRTQQ